MRIPEAEIERIRSTRSILEFMDNPKRSGRCFTARCPLPGHKDRTPSFFLYPDGGYWCFGCGRGGKDIIRFAFHYWDLSWPKDFPLALEKLGARTGGNAGGPFLPRATVRVAPQRETWPTLPDATTVAVYRVAAEIWQHALWKPTSRDALNYLHRRGLADDLIRREGMGFATDILADALRRGGLDPMAAQAVGLLQPNEHEVFAGRVVWWEWRHIGGVRTPVWATARVCGAGAVWDDAPKYLNVRGDRLLGGLEGALGAPEVAVVEGSFDRLALVAMGEPAVFLGSNDPSDAILSELRRLARRSILYFVRDQDRAGRRGMWRTLYKLDPPPAARVIVVDLPRGLKDPGDLAAHPDGATLYQAAKRRGRPIDLDRFKSRCERFHVLVEQRKAGARRAGGTRYPPSRRRCPPIIGDQRKEQA